MGIQAVFQSHRSAGDSIKWSVALLFCAEEESVDPAKRAYAAAASASAKPKHMVLHSRGPGTGLDFQMHISW